MTRDLLPTAYFALVVVYHEDRFLLVHERKFGQTWYLPAGRVDAGELLADAARRETREETGIEIVLEGILRIEHTPAPDSTRLRVIFVARPAADTPPKTRPDEHSLGAGWFTLDEIAGLPLRGPEVRSICGYVARSGPVFPLDLITTEGASFTLK